MTEENGDAALCSYLGEITVNLENPHRYSGMGTLELGAFIHSLTKLDPVLELWRGEASLHQAAWDRSGELTNGRNRDPEELPMVHTHWSQQCQWWPVTLSLMGLALPLSSLEQGTRWARAPDPHHEQWESRSVPVGLPTTSLPP